MRLSRVSQNKTLLGNTVFAVIERFLVKTLLLSSAVQATDCITLGKKSQTFVLNWNPKDS